MNKKEYLNTPIVKEFIEWIGPKLSSSGKFRHHYIDAKTKDKLNFDSIYSAYRDYSWRFKYFDPITKSNISGNSFSDSERELNKLSVALKIAIENKSDNECKELCNAILEWGLGKGSAYKNNMNLIDKEENISQSLNYRSTILDLNKIDLDDKLSYNSIKINAGFTKIYSTIVDNFIIYDSRVGSALCLLIRNFCTQKNIIDLPEALTFGWENGKTSNPIYRNRRNPNNASYSFPKLNKRNWLNMNVKASWLSKSILDSNPESDFNLLPPNQRIRALEAAFFMIGYSI